MAWANFQHSGFVCFDITCLPLKNVSTGILFIFRCLVVFLKMLQKIVSNICLVQKIINFSTLSPLLESIHILEFSSINYNSSIHLDVTNFAHRDGYHTKIRINERERERGIMWGWW